MSVSSTWTLFGVVLVYAIAVSTYVAVSSVNTVGPVQSSGFDFLASFGLLTFSFMLGSAIGFMLLVGILDLVTNRKQQAVVALSVGLAASATYQVIIQTAFVQSYAYYKSMPIPQGSQPSPTPANTDR